ncbi:MAG TPA: tetratricopeptide repeat protein [Blastocatellia bacterium]|nr:tetratricopeptide repeat protein [Blastocatellia bacterium]
MKAPRLFQRLCLVLAVTSLSSAAPPQNQPSDETALIVLITRYYAAYSKKDLGALVVFWSLRSPDLPAGLEEAQQTLASGAYPSSDVSVSQIKVVDHKAILQASAFFESSDAQIGVRRQEKRVRNFALFKEAGEWKIWREADNSKDLSAFLEKGSEWKVSADSLEQFAISLVNANEEERQRLLADNKKMVTTELRDALTRKVGHLQVPGSYALAVSVLRLVHNIAEQLGDNGSIAMAERQLGDAFREWGRWADALKHYQDAAAMYEAMGRRNSKAATLISIGQVYFAQKNHKLAIENYEKALAEFESLNIARAIADTFEELASVYYDQESYDRALELLVKCLRLRETFAGKAEIAATLNSIGNAYFQQQEFDSAIKHYQKALAGFEELNNSGANALKDPDAIVSTMSNIASAEYSQGSYEAALDYYLRALTLQETLRDKRVAANLRLSMANIYSAMGNYAVALDYLQQGLAVFEAFRDKTMIASTLSEAAEAYFQLRNYDLALSNYQRSAQIFEELKSAADTSMRLYAIGNVHFFMSSFDLAIESYEKALTQFEVLKHAPGVASMLASIAGTRYAQQKYDLALEFYQKSLAQYEALGDKSRAAGVIERIASVRYAKGEYAASLEIVGRAIELAEQNANSDALWRARYTQGLALAATDKIEQARDSFQLAIATIEFMRGKLVHGEPDAQHFFQNKNAAYSAMMELLIAQNRIAEAFSYAERMRVNSLIDIFQRAHITRSMTPAEVEQESKFERTVIATKAQMAHEREKRQPNLQRYATLDLRLQESLGNYRAFETALYAEHPRLKTLRSEASPRGLQDAAALLSDTSMAFIEFVVADSCTYLFALTRESKNPAGARSRDPVYVLNAYVIKAGRGEIADRVKTFREMIAQRDAKIQQTARETYELLFNGAREQLSGKTTWLIAPDGALWQMPFAALQPAENRYLIEDHAIAYAPSLTALIEMTRPRDVAKPTRVSPSLLALGNPAITKRTADQAKLLSDREAAVSPESENEVKSLERLYTATRCKVYVDAQASEPLVKQEAHKFNVIHLAAPALLSDANPLYSYVALSHSEGSGNDDGLLEVREILKLNLSADLLVLSSSEGSPDRYATGDAMSCLAWSLFVAGCPSSITGGWPIGSPSTTELMLELHRRLQAGSTSRALSSKAKDLQRAMLRVLRGGKHQHPFYWAGFSLVGDFR